jgi:CRISPR-associated protein Csd1
MILQSLVTLYERDGKMAPFGFEYHPYYWAVVLDEKGRVTALEDERVDGTALPLLVPVWASNRTSNALPSFLTDPAQYVLGLDKHRTTKWIEHNLALLATAGDPRLVAVRRWLEGWTAEAGVALAGRHGAEWSQPVAIKIGDEYAHEVPEARDLWERYLGESAGPEGLCLVSGETAPLATTHGTLVLAESGKLVSFDADSTALRHWGYEGNDNAPISERASHAYVTALKALKDRGQVAYLAGLSIAYWTEATGVAGRAWAAEFEAALAGRVAPIAENETRDLAHALEALRRGQIPPDTSPDAAYHVLAIAPGKGRHAIRWQLHSTLGDYCEHVRKHALNIGLQRAPPIYRLLSASRHERSKTPAPIALAMVKAVLTGAAYPSSLATGVLCRLRVGEEITWEQAAVLRGWLTRNCKLSEETMTTSAAYRLGQVLRVVERMQLAGNPKIAITVRGRLWGLLATRPAAALDRLMDGIDIYKTAMRREGKGGLAEWYDNHIAELLTGLELPAIMTESDRAQMALGYYAERGRRAADETSQTTNTATVN